MSNVFYCFWIENVLIIGVNLIFLSWLYTLGYYIFPPINEIPCYKKEIMICYIGWGVYNYDNYFMKISKDVIERRKKLIHHLNRIQGQIDTLKEYINSDKDCSDIAMLTTSIVKSFDSIRAKTLEGYVIHELLEGQELTQKKKETIQKIIALYKK